MNSSPARRSTVLFLGLLFLGAALRLCNAHHASLWLDDFHSLHHARAADLATFFRVLELDNHPPLSFLLVRASRALFGEDEWALRLPALLAGLGTLALVWRISRRLSCLGGRAAATLLVAVSSLHVELSSDVRMYSLLALAAAGLLDGLLDLLEEGRGRLRTAAWIGVGLHAHYHFLFPLAALGAGALLLALARPLYAPRRRALLAELALGVALALPWYLLVFPNQLGHGLAPGGSDATPARLLEGWAHLVFLDISVAGPLPRLAWIAASAIFLVLAPSGCLALWRAERARGRGALPCLLALGALAVPLCATLAAWLSPRSGFEWRYMASAIAPFALLVGAEACAPLRRAAVAFVCASAALLAAFNAVDPGEEDYRGAIAELLERARPGDAVVAADWQPTLFPHAIGWEYYAPRLARGAPLPERLEYRDDFSLVRPHELAGRQRVFCCLRGLRDQCGILRALRQRFPHEEVRVFGRSVYLHEFSEAPGDRGN